MKLPPVGLLVLCFGAGLATGLARFPDPSLVIPALLVLAVALRGREILSLLVAGAFVGQLAAVAAWHGEGGSCASFLPKGSQTLTIVPLDSTTLVQLGDDERERLQKYKSPLTTALEALYRLWLESPKTEPFVRPEPPG